MSRRTDTDVGTRARAVQAALDVGGHRLEEAAVRRARALLAKQEERQRLSGEHTVVALAVATGSGKSSLYNALAGLDLAATGARRPTTATASACVWGGEGADALLDWLGVPRRHRVEPSSELDAGRPDPLRGLVLLDLPDHDSTQVAHRLEVDRLVELVDVFVWVTDPQKYADAALHRRYLSRLAGHDAVTVVVLNQIDRLAPDAVQACRRDLQRLVEADGLRGVHVVVTSATTGQGVDELRGLIGQAVGRRSAWQQRIGADLDAVVRELGEGVGASELDPDELADDTGLVDALAGAAGVPAVVQAVQADYLRSAVGMAGWPVTRWGRRLRPDPLRRLRLGPQRRASLPRMAKTTLPRATPAHRSRVELATRRVGERAGQGLPVRWQDAARAAAGPPGEDLADALDQAVLGTDLGTRTALWWRFLGAVQAVLAVSAAAGLGWLLAVAVTGWLQLPQPRTPYVGVLPVPTLLAVGGLLLGAVLGLVVRAMAGVGASRRAARARRRLHESIELVARQRVLAPVETVLRDHRETRAHLDAAGLGELDRRERAKKARGTRS